MADYTEPCPTTNPTRRRWENATRYVETRVLTDLWGERVLVKAWGGKGNRLDGLSGVAVGDESIALELAKIEKTRRRRGYAEVVGFVSRET